MGYLVGIPTTQGHHQSRVTSPGTRCRGPRRFHLLAASQLPPLEHRQVAPGAFPGRCVGLGCRTLEGVTTMP